MDLTKFISLLANEALYFSCPSEFHDPFEGFIPKSLAIEAAKKNELALRDFELKREEIANFQRYNFNSGPQFLGPYDDALNGLNNSLMETIREHNSKHGVNCWHKSDYESEAMWKLYSVSGQGIAIESTVEQLKDSIIDDGSLRIESVHYLSEDSQDMTS